MKTIIGFERKGGGDWLIYDDGTKLSTCKGDRILRRITAIQDWQVSFHNIEAIWYIVSHVMLKITTFVHDIFKKLIKRPK